MPLRSQSSSFSLSLFAAQDVPTAADWPQWRGPSRNGVAVGARLPKTWPKSLPAPLWRVPVGIGYSSPVIAKRQVFLTGCDDKGNEMCQSLAADTGKILWRVAYPSTFAPPDPTAGKGPNSTPTMDGDRVYMLGLGGMFHCLQAKTGKVLWKHDLAREYWGVAKSEAGDAWFPVCGASASALVDGQMVILPVGGTKAGAFAAFDRRTGARLWGALEDRSSYASPLFANIAGTRQLIGFTGKRMVGLDAATRKLLWEFPFTAMFEQTIVSPVVWQNRVIVCGEAKPVTVLQITSQNGVTQQTTLWQNSELCAYLVTPVVVKDHLVGFDQRGRRLTCIDLATGKTAWTSPRIGKMFVSLVVVGEQILALSDSGDLHVLAANTAQFTQLAQIKVTESGAVWSEMAVVGNRVYIRDAKHLTCYALGAKPA